MTAQQLRSSVPAVRSSSAKPTLMNLPWAHPRRTRHFLRHAILGIRIAFPAALLAVQQRPWLPISASPPWAPTPAVLSVSRRPFVGSWASNRPTAASAATVSLPSLPPWIKGAHDQRRQRLRAHARIHSTL